jgi:hypothetical protein
VNHGPIWGRLLEKTRGRQSRATVPLMEHYFRQGKKLFSANIARNEPQIRMSRRKRVYIRPNLGYKLGDKMGSFDE